MNEVIKKVIDNILDDHVITDREIRMLKAFELGFSKDEVINLIHQEAHKMNMSGEKIDKAINKYIDSTAEFRK